MNFLSSTAAVATAATAVRLPQPTTPFLTSNAAKPLVKSAYLAAPAPGRPRPYADQSRYRAQCRVAMSF